MSLVIDISINRERIVSVVTAQRITGTEGDPQADDVNIYKVTRLERRPDSGLLFEHTRGNVSHRYGDGATALAAKALAEVYVEGEEWP